MNLNGSVLGILWRFSDGCEIKIEWGAGVVICLERGADLRMPQLMPLPLTVSCFSKIQPSCCGTYGLVSYHIRDL